MPSDENEDEESHMKNHHLKAREFASSGDIENKIKTKNDLEMFQKELSIVWEEGKHSLDHVGVEKLNPLSVYVYSYNEVDDAVKNTSWKHDESIDFSRRCNCRK